MGLVVTAICSTCTGAFITQHVMIDKSRLGWYNAFDVADLLVALPCVVESAFCENWPHSEPY